MRAFKLTTIAALVFVVVGAHEARADGEVEVLRGKRELTGLSSDGNGGSMDLLKITVDLRSGARAAPRRRCSRSSPSAPAARASTVCEPFANVLARGVSRTRVVVHAPASASAVTLRGSASPSRGGRGRP